MKYKKIRKRSHARFQRTAFRDCFQKWKRRWEKRVRLRVSPMNGPRECACVYSYRRQIRVGTGIRRTQTG